MKRVLGIDYGGKRTGLCVTDMLQISINPLPTVKTDELWRFLKRCLSEEEVETIVIGYPTHSDGTPTKLTEQIDELINRVKSSFQGIDIVKVDESYTSQQARNNLIQMGVKKKARRQKENIDRGSAVLILKSYLDQKYQL